jgi:hypothetical protein
MGRVCSIFSQILRFIPRSIFESAVREHQTEKHAKGMTSWSQFIALLFCHLGGARSLREIVGGLAASEGKLKHLGVDRAPTRSTLAYANEHRRWQLYKSMFDRLAAVCRDEANEKKRKFRFKHPLLTLDATVIPVCVSMFEWASYVKSKGAVKLHMVLDNASFLPQYAVITPGNTGDVTAAKKMEFTRGTMLVFDRGYEDHNWWRKLNATGVYFVSRLKDNASYIIAETRTAVDGTNVLHDEVVILASDKESADPMRLRRIEVWLEDKQDTMVFITNHLKLAASTIAAIYKDRWQIELFFENSTWGTPLDVMIFRGSIALNRPLVGSLDACVRPRIARRPRGAVSRVRSHKPAMPATVSTESTAIQWSV